MTGKLFDGTQTTVADSTLDLSIKRESFRKLRSAEAEKHIGGLVRALERLSTLLRTKSQRPECDDKELCLYVDKLAAALNALAIKDKIDGMSTLGDLKADCAIHPTDSGFPVFIRDLSSLSADKDEAAAKLSALPRDEELVDAALFGLFRGQYPKDAVYKKIARNYYTYLQKTELPRPFASLDDVVVSKNAHCTLHKKSAERLDDTANLPRFYSLYFRVSDSCLDEGWHQYLEDALREGMGTASSLELPYLARIVEDAPGIMLDMAFRYTIGPFYNRYTVNTGAIGELIENEGDFILFFKKSMVQRIGQKFRKGFANYFKGIYSGDRHEGAFSPALDSPTCALMPNRLVQKAHDRKLSIGKNVQPYGFSKAGGLID